MTPGVLRHRRSRSSLRRRPACASRLQSRPGWRRHDRREAADPERAEDGVRALEPSRRLGIASERRIAPGFKRTHITKVRKRGERVQPARIAACAAFRSIRYSWTNRACLGVNFIGAIRYLRPMAQHPPDQPDPHACQAMMLVLPYLNQILIWQYYENARSPRQCQVL